MIAISAQTKIYLALGTIDIRKGFDGQCGLVIDTLKQDPLNGALFLFINRRRDRLKVFYWDGDGLAIWYRRLEQGTFQIPTVSEGATSIQMQGEDFTMLLRGINFTKAPRRKCEPMGTLDRCIKNDLCVPRLASTQELESLAAQEEAEQVDASDSEEKKKPKPTGRGKLPSNLPREVRRYELSEEQRKWPCCGDTRHEMGVESSEQLEFIPAVFKIVERQRVQYDCRNCQENVAIADKPPQPIEKGVPGPGLGSYVVLSEFGDHLPVYREEDLFNRMGWDLRRSTICQWLGTLGVLVDPLIGRMKHSVLQSKVIHTDDTKIKLMDLGTCQDAKFWPYLGDWLHPYVVFDFTQDRKRFGPKNFLKDYKGYLQVDAYAGYDCVYTSGKVKEVACWIHARRYWHEARDYDSERANIALGYIARLAQIEWQLRDSFPNRTLQGERDFEAVASARQRYSLPILREFKKWLDCQLNEGRILPKSLIKSAFTYTLNQWDALCRYTEAGYLSMDNNAAERLVKSPAIGRRNYLFVGNDRAGCNAANFYSLVTSAKLNGVEPFQWLRAIFEALPKYRNDLAFSQSEEGLPVTSTELDHLLPDRWLQAHPEHQWTIDLQRRKEREQTEKRRKQLRKRKKTK